MSTHPDGHCTSTTLYPANEKPESLWPGKMGRTYLWALAVQKESRLAEYESDTSCDYDHSSFDAYPSVRVNFARCSLRLWDEMAHTPLSNVNCSRHKLLDPSQGVPLLLRRNPPRVASFDSLRPTLPDSPRHICLVRSRTPSPSTKTNHFVNSVVTARRPTETMEPVRCNDTEGRKVGSRRPTVSSVSRPPAIILSPSSPGSTSQSFASFASDSEFPSAPASTISDDCTSTSSDSTPASINEKLLQITYPRVLVRMRTVWREDHTTRLLPLSESQFKIVRQSQAASDQLVATIDLSECRSVLSPGRHGWVLPHVSSLRHALTSHSMCPFSGTHVFTRRKPGAQFQYDYCGSYRVKIGARSILRSIETSLVGPEEQGIFFLKFLSFDEEIVSLVNALTSPGEVLSGLPRQLSPHSAWCSEVKKKTRQQRMRVVSVDGVDFEIESSPVAWDHGSFRE